MTTFKIIFDREKCIGAYSCVNEDPEKWIPANDGKVDLKESKPTNPNIFEKIITEAEVEKARLSATVCPVSAIQVVEQ
ncbi:MAG: ferredoxin [archaeon]|nr:ferredoxin [archaeon]